MKKLSDKGTIDEIIARINLIKEDSQPLWGKMKPAQMFAHLQRYMELTYGKIKLKRELIGLFLSPIAKRDLRSDKLLEKNLPTNPYFVVNDARDFETEKLKLINFILKLNEGKSVLIGSHPFFGKLNPEEWEVL